MSATAISVAQPASTIQPRCVECPAMRLLHRFPRPGVADYLYVCRDCAKRLCRSTAGIKRAYGFSKAVKAALALCSSAAGQIRFGNSTEMYLVDEFEQQLARVQAALEAEKAKKQPPQQKKKKKKTSSAVSTDASAGTAPNRAMLARMAGQEKTLCRCVSCKSRMVLTTYMFYRKSTGNQYHVCKRCAKKPGKYECLSLSQVKSRYGNSKRVRMALDECPSGASPSQRGECRKAFLKQELDAFLASH